MPSIFEIVRQPISDAQKIDLLEKELKAGATLDENDPRLEEKAPSILHAAVFNSGELLLSWLLARKPDLIDALSEAGTNVLFYAAKFNNMAAVQFFLKHPTKGKTLALATNKNNLTFNTFAAYSGNLAMLDLALKCREDALFSVNETNPNSGLVEAIKEASFKGYHDMLKVLVLKFKAPIDQMRENGWFPIHTAAQKGHVATVSTLLDLKADIEQRVQDSWGGTALLVAARCGQEKVVEQLIQLKANLAVYANEAKENEDKEMLHALHLAAKYNHPNTVRLLVANKVNVDIVTKDKWETPSACFAAGHGNSRVLETLLELKADIHKPGKSGWFPIHCAAKWGHEEAISLLIAHRVDVNLPLQNEWGDTVLQIAAINGQENSVKKLMELKADFTLYNKEGRNALHLATQNGHPNVVRFLIASNSDIEEKTKDEWQMTPAYMASSYNSPQVLETLIALKADIHCPAKSGLHPIHGAASWGHAETIQLLVENKANVNQLTQQTGYNPTQKTPAYYAASKGKIKALQKLLDLGADCHQPQHFEQSFFYSIKYLIEAAAQGGHTDIIKLLVTKYKVDINCVRTDPTDLRTPLYIAAHFQRASTIIWLLRNGASLHAGASKNLTPFEVALEVPSLVNPEALIALYHPSSFNQLSISSRKICPRPGYAMHSRPLAAIFQIKNCIKLIECILAHSLQPERTLDILKQEHRRSQEEEKDLPPFPIPSSQSKVYLALAREQHRFMFDRKTDYIEIRFIEKTVNLLLPIILTEKIIFRTRKLATTISNYLIKFLCPEFLTTAPSEIIAASQLITNSIEFKKDGSLVNRLLFWQKLNAPSANDRFLTTLPLQSVQIKKNLQRKLTVHKAPKVIVPRSDSAPVIKRLKVESMPGHLPARIPVQTPSVAKLRVSGHLQEMKTQVMELNVPLKLEVKVNYGWLPIHQAAEQGNIEILSYLIANKANIDEPVHNTWGGRAIHIATMNGHCSVVRALIALKADVNKPDKSGAYPIHWAAKKGYAGIIRLLVANKSDIEVKTENSEKSTSAMIATGFGQHQVVKTLIEFKADIQRLIHVAAINDQEDIIQLLVDNKANVNERLMKKQDEITPVGLAACFGKAKALQKLLALKADCHKPQIYSRNTSPSGDATYLIEIAARFGRIEIIKLLVTHYKVNINFINPGNFLFKTPLFFATRSGQDSVIWLLRNGASEVAGAANSITPFEVADVYQRQGVMLALYNPSSFNQLSIDHRRISDGRGHHIKTDCIYRIFRRQNCIKFIECLLAHSLHPEQTLELLKILKQEHGSCDPQGPETPFPIPDAQIGLYLALAREHHRFMFERKTDYIEIMLIESSVKLLLSVIYIKQQIFTKTKFDPPLVDLIFKMLCSEFLKTSPNEIIAAAQQKSPAPEALPVCSLTYRISFWKKINANTTGNLLLRELPLQSDKIKKEVSEKLSADEALKVPMLMCDEEPSSKEEKDEIMRDLPPPQSGAFVLKL